MAEPRAFATTTCWLPHWRGPGICTPTPTRPNLAALAAAYAFGIACNHAFIDGNKRTAFVVCVTFLRLNGSDLIAEDEEKYQMFLRLAEGTVTEKELADWIRAHSAA